MKRNLLKALLVTGSFASLMAPDKVTSAETTLGKVRGAEAGLKANSSGSESVTRT